MSNYGIVYLITNKVNMKRYVGITTKEKGFNGRYTSKGKGIERVYNHLNNSKNTFNYYNEHLFNSIKKYGFESFTIDEEIDVADNKEELLLKERYWINYYKSNNYKYGYNCTSGGEGLEGGTQNFLSKLKRRRTNAETTNRNLNYWHKKRSSWENPYLYIWDYNDGLGKQGKELLWHKLKGGKTKFCKVCGVEYYRSGKGDYCKYCGEEDFLKQFKEHKKIIKNIDYKIENS